MERTMKQILALMLIFVTRLAVAAPAGEPQEYSIKTSYNCQTNGVIVKNSNRPVGGPNMQEVRFTANPGRNQTLTFGNREYMIWPRVAGDTFDKNINVLARNASGKFYIVQETGLGSAQKTTTTVALTLKPGTPEEKPVTCKVEMEWVKKFTAKTVASK